VRTAAVACDVLPFNCCASVTLRSTLCASRNEKKMRSGERADQEIGHPLSIHLFVNRAFNDYLTAIPKCEVHYLAGRC
jgi:hypothetical protein